MSLTHRRRNLAVAGSLAALLAVGGLSACGAEEPKTEKADISQQDDTGDKPAGKKKAEEKSADGPLAAGDTAVYGDLKVTVSKATPYEVDEFSETPEGHKSHQVTVTLENTSEKKFDATLTLLMARSGEEGLEAEEIFDGKVGGGFSGNLLPGKKATAVFAFFAPEDAKNLDIEVNTADWDQEPAQWGLDI